MSNVVEAITKLNITGNVVPSSWWRSITFDNGKPDAVGVVVLSEIIYWYRAKEVRDETSGAIIGYKKRFHADKLQRSYQSLADKFGFTKRQVTDSLKRLQKSSIVTLEFRSITVNGQQLSNVLYIEPVAEAIERITYPDDLLRSNADPLTFERDTLLRLNVTPPTLERETYTKTTQKNTTKEKDNAVSQAKAAHVSLPDNLRSTWNELAERLGLPSIRVISEEKAKLVKDAYRFYAKLKKLEGENEVISIEEFIPAYLDRVKDLANPFHLGENDRGWKMDFGYVFSKKVVEHVINDGILKR